MLDGSYIGGLILLLGICVARYAYKKEMQEKLKNRKIPENIEKNTGQEENIESYFEVFYDVLNTFGFEISSFEKNMLDSGYILLDKSPFDMALSYIMPVVASKSFKNQVKNGEVFLPVHIACFSKALFENGNISENQYRLLNQIIDLNIYNEDVEDAMVDDFFTLSDLSNQNQSPFPAMPNKCRINLEASLEYLKMRNIFKQRHQIDGL